MSSTETFLNFVVITLVLIQNCYTAATVNLKFVDCCILVVQP